MSTSKDEVIKNKTHSNIFASSTLALELQKNRVKT